MITLSDRGEKILIKAVRIFMGILLIIFLWPVLFVYFCCKKNH